MRFDQVHRETIDYLRKEGKGLFQENPSLDSFLLISHCTGISREWFYSHGDELVTQNQYEEIKRLRSQRAAGRPMAYILGHKEFWGMEFNTDDRALIPRPETEHLIEECLMLQESVPENASVLDLCTGSGCIAISLKKEKPDWRISASDISSEALELAKSNEKKLLSSNSIQWYEGDLFQSINTKFHIICSNPPYLKGEEMIEFDEKNWDEPRNALFGGANGLEFYERIIKESREYLYPSGFIIFEAADWQSGPILSIFKLNKYEGILVKKDLAGNDRVIVGRLNE